MDPEARETYSFAMQWFTTHAQQRMQILNFWFVAVSFLTTASIMAVTGDQPALALVIDAALVGSSVVFYGLDLRTQELIAYGERAMSTIEADWPGAKSGHSLTLAHEMHTANRSAPSYRRLFAVLYLGAALMGLALFITTAI